jgi:aquaporin Z
MDGLKKYSAELLGTFVLVFIGTGTAVIAGAKVGYLGIAIAFGLAVLALVYAIGPISGCHINPAITISMLAAGKIPSRDALFYIVAQCIGAVIASGLVLMIASGTGGYSPAANGLGQNGYGDASPGHYDMAAGFAFEVIMTFIFLMVIFGATSKTAEKGFAGIAIGLTLLFIHDMGIAVTGVSVNPARSLGPALFVGGTALSQLWLFIVAPVIGGIIAAFAWKYLFENPAVPM